MRRSVWLRSGGFFVAGLLLVLGCGDGDGGTTTEPDPTEIVATVRVDGSGQGGLTVRLFSAGGSSALAQQTTGTNGRVTFSDLDAGSYDLEVTVPTDLELDAGESARKSVSVASGQSASVTFDLVDPTSGGDELVDVSLLGASFSPAEVTIPVGGTVRWTNTSSVTHTITPDGHNQWTSVTVTNQNDTFSHTFDAAGEFPYECTLHAGMTGQVTVQ